MKLAYDGGLGSVSVTLARHIRLSWSSSTRFQMLMIWISFFLTAGVHTSAAPPTSTTSTAMGAVPAGSRDLNVYLLNEAGAAPQILRAAEAEAGEIWAGVGLRLTWLSSPAPVDVTSGRTVVVILRHAIPQADNLDAADSDASVHPPLGWLTFDKDERPGNVIEVSFDTLTSVVMKGSRMNRPIASLPSFAQRPLLGLGLGRVVAHEVGHWLMGRGHTQEGLMKALFSVRDLLEWQAVRLPRAWTAEGSELRLALLSRCELDASNPCRRSGAAGG